MTTISREAPTRPIPLDLRRTALIAGVFYVITFVSIPTLALYGPVHAAGFITGRGPDGGVVVGGVLEMIVGLAGIGTAVTLYPVLRRQGEARALGLVAARVLEATAIFVGVASLLTMVELRRSGVGADALLTGRTLIAFYDSVFLISQGFIPAVNAVLLGSLLYQSRLVPRVLPMVGFVGTLLIISSDAGVLFDLWSRLSPVTAIATIPIAVWELALGVYLIVKGFRPTAPTAALTATDRPSNARFE